LSPRCGEVWNEDRRVGSLREDDRGALRFTYDPGWLDQGGFPVSVRLPLSIGTRETPAHSFFSGLLPEGGVRQRLCRKLGIDPEDDVGLLLAIGEDCAGALSVLPAGAMPAERDPPPAKLDPRRIDRLVRSLGFEAPTPEGAPRRFSLAGVQEKQPVSFDGESYALPSQSHPSSHILKFETVPYVCAAEFLANDMARRVELPVVETEFMRSAGRGKAVPFLRIVRYDRRGDAAMGLRRVHQEDVLQALDTPPGLKYQRDGGPSLRDAARLLRDHVAQPARAVALLRDWQIFNHLVGNYDGHGKNLALLYPPGESVPDLAPFYDVVSIKFLNAVRPGTWARDMAFAIGHQFAPERITRNDWEALAEDLGMPPTRLLDRLEDLCARMPAVASDARQAFAARHGNEAVYDKLERSVQKRCRWVRRSVFDRK